MAPLLLLQGCAPGSRFENYGWVYQTRDANCTHARAQIEGFGAGGGLFRQETAAKYALGGLPWGEWTPCAINWSRPEYYLAGIMTFHKWGVPRIPLRPQWYACTSTGFYYNTRQASELEGVHGYHPGQMPCGEGYYFNATEAAVRNGSDWSARGPLNTDLLWLR